jgi:hypothetical protein
MPRLQPTAADHGRIEGDGDPDVIARQVEVYG